MLRTRLPTMPCSPMCRMRSPLSPSNQPGVASLAITPACATAQAAPTSTDIADSAALIQVLLMLSSLPVK
ncbi:hypothetical protein AB595_07065 [Massilia sp. WF1]|nr:hypothetical protein AB595_07065 [Massilia sp. WF1]